MNKCELLAPSGDMECIKTAVKYGADAVYIGGTFMQLRAKNVGFTMETIKEAADFLHENGKKLYVTVNSFAKNEEIPLLAPYARELLSLGVDAAIVSDIGAVYAMKSAVPELEIHISTQANCQNYKAAEMYYNMGASRVVLGRELSLEEIKEIRALAPKELELEAFIHGAMCMSYSGRCMISAFLNGRSANRGECTQPCRWQYHLVEQTRPNTFIPVEIEDGSTAILSSADLKTISFIDDIVSAGINSLKIEGRMKTPYYVGTVVNAYRHALDKTAPLEVLEHELECVSHRPYSSGFYFGELKTAAPNDGAYHQECVFVGVVKDYEDGVLTVEQRNKFIKGDELEVLSPNSIGEKFTVSEMTDENGEEVLEASHAQQILKIPCNLKLSKGDILRKRK